MFIKILSPKKLIKLFCLICVSFFNISGCAVQTSPTSENLQQQYFNSYVGVSAFTYKELVDKSGLIVVGQMIDKAETFNTSRNPTNVHKPHPELYSIGQIYVFSVEKYIKGDGKKTIYIVNREGVILSGEPTSSMIEQARLESSIYRFTTGTSYLLFLSPCCKSAAGYDIPDRVYYSGSAEPWLFEISTSNQNTVTEKSQWEDAARYFPALNLTDIIKIVENPSAIPDPSNPYPPPQNNNSFAEPNKSYP